MPLLWWYYVASVICEALLRGGGGYMLPCSSEINWLVPLFPQILFSYIPCSLRLSLFTQCQHDVLRDNMYSNGSMVNFIELDVSMMSYGITCTVMLPWSILLNRKPKNGFQGSEKKKHVIVITEDTKSIK